MLLSRSKVAFLADPLLVILNPSAKNMENSAENQICSRLYFSKTSLLCASVIVPSLACSWFFVPVLSPPLLLTFSVLVLSTVSIFTFTNKRVIERARSIQDENPNQKIEENEDESRDDCGSESTEPESATNRRVIQKARSIPDENPKQKIEENGEDCGDDCGSESTEPESVTSEVSEGRSPATSDCLMSDDEDSLIEITLPGQDESAYFKEEPKQKPVLCLPESILPEQGLEELLADIHEVNEEDNLIEIDISVGSIKCSRFEIEA